MKKNRISHTFALSLLCLTQIGISRPSWAAKTEVYSATEEGAAVLNAPPAEAIQTLAPVELTQPKFVRPGAAGATRPRKSAVVMKEPVRAAKQRRIEKRIVALES